MLVFDLDGTLVDTRRAVEEAYALAGVVLTDSQWGRPWHEWCARGAHQRKVAAYPTTLRLYAKKTALFDYAVLRQCYILTSASQQAVDAIEELFRCRLNVAFVSATLEEKITWLCQRGEGIYVDDNDAARVVIAKRTPWKVMSPEDFLFTQSSLQPGLTID